MGSRVLVGAEGVGEGVLLLLLLEGELVESL